MSPFKEFQEIQKKKGSNCFSDASSPGMPLLKCHLPNGIVAGHITWDEERKQCQASFTKEGKPPVYGELKYCMKVLKRRANFMRVKYAIKRNFFWLIPLLVMVFGVAFATWGSSMQPYEIGTIVIALCAVWFTAWQATEERKHNRISVLPRLNVVSRIDPAKKNKEWKWDIFYKIENKGLGPAFITESQIVVDGKTCSAEEAIELILQGENYYLVGEKEVNNRTAISSGKTLIWFQFQVGVNTIEEAKEIRKLIDKRTNIKIQYESAYGEKQEYPLTVPELE